MKGFSKTVFGAVLIVVMAISTGFVANAINPHGLPLKRVPLKETHRTASAHEFFPPKTNQVAKIVANSSIKAKTSSISTSKPVKTAVAVPSIPNSVKNRAITARSATKPIVRAKKIEALFTTLADAKSLFDRKAALFIDARSIEDYNAEHIDGAVSLPYDNLKESYEQVLGNVPKDRLIVTYCNDAECSTSTKLADDLVARGHTRVLILLDGLPGWRDAGYPTISVEAIEQ